MERLFFLFFLALFAFTSCRPLDDNAGRTLDAVKYDLQITDTLKLQHPALLRLTDFDGRRYLLFDLFSGEIVIADQSGKPLASFRHLGPGPEEYEEVRGLSFFNNDQIMVTTAYKYLIYSEQGAYISGGNFPEGFLNDPAQNSRVFSHTSNGGSSLILAGAVVDFSTFDFEHYMPYTEMNHASIFDLSTGQVRSGIQHDPEVYGKRVYPNDKAPKFTVQPERNLVHAVFPYEKTLYTYRLGDLKLQSKRATDPTFFKDPKTLPMQKNIPFGDPGLFRLELKNCKYSSIHALENGQLLLAYETGVKGEVDNYYGIADLMQDHSIMDTKETYLQLMGDEGKISADIKVPQEYIFFHAFNTDRIILLPRKLDKEPEFATYYIANLITAEEPQLGQTTGQPISQNSIQN